MQSVYAGLGTILRPKILSGSEYKSIVFLIK